MSNDRDADEFEAIVDAEFNEAYTKRVQESGKSNDEPKPYDTALRDDTERAYDALVARDEAREKARKDYGEYHKLAREHGTTIREGLDRYRAHERQLQQNPIDGLATIARNYGLSPAQVAAGFREMAARGHGGLPDQARGHQALVVDGAIAAARRDLPDFDKHEEAICEALNGRVIHKTGDPAHDLLTAYNHVVKRAREAADVERAKKGNRSSYASSNGHSGGRQPGMTTRETSRSGSRYDDDLRADVEAAFNGRYGG